MRIVNFGFLVLLTCCLIGNIGCKNTLNQHKLSLNLVDSFRENVNYDSVYIDVGVNPYLDDSNRMVIFYNPKGSNEIKRKILSTGEENRIAVIPEDIIHNLSSFNVEGDTSYLFIDNPTNDSNHSYLTVLSKDFYKALKVSPSRKNYFFKNPFGSTFGVKGHIIFVQIGINNGTNFIGKNSDLACFFDPNWNLIRTLELAPFPKYYQTPRERHYRDNIRVLGDSTVYYGFERSDTVLKYNYNNLNAFSTIRMFTDLKDKGSLEYDTSKATDMAYLNSFTSLAEVNIGIRQKQEEDQAYFLKRLERKDIEEEPQYILGLVKAGQYVGSVKLPKDFNWYFSYISNNELYYGATEGKNSWKHYHIKVD